MARLGHQSAASASTSRATAKASSKPKLTAFSASRMRTSSRCWTSYLTLPIASAPMPTALRAVDRLRVVHHADTGQPFGRHRIDVGGDQHPASQMPERRPAHHLHAGRGDAHHDVGVGQRGPQVVAVMPPTRRSCSTPKRWPVCSAAACATAALLWLDSSTVAPSCAAQHAGDAADRAGAAEHQHPLAGEVGLVVLAQAPPRSPRRAPPRWCTSRSDRRTARR